jgi:hypothetical protein
MVSMDPCHGSDPGSIPGFRALLFVFSPQTTHTMASVAGQRSSETEASFRERVAALVKAKNCGPLVLRLSWHDAGCRT